MVRAKLVPAIALVVAIASISLVVLLEQQTQKSRSAQLTLAGLKNELNQLQGLPWQVQNPKFGSPTKIRALMGESERRIIATIDRLRRSSLPVPLAQLSEPVQANFASLDRIFAMGLEPTGWNDPGPTIEVSQAENVSLAEALGALDSAGLAYAHRARVSDAVALFGSAGVILALLGAFVFYYRRSVRVTQSQERALVAKEAAHRELQETLVQLERAQEERGRLLERTVVVAEHERIRVAMNLHDGPIQQLTALAFSLDRLARRIERGELEDIETLIADVRCSLSAEMESLRRLMVELRPPILDERGLTAALNDAAGNVLKDTPTRWDVRSEIGERRFAPELETVVYRVVNEALVNVRKHAQATRADVAIEHAGDSLRLVVADDGRGFDASGDVGPPDGSRYGLLGMEERVESLGGTWRIESGSGAGTRIEALLPLRTRDTEATHEHALAVA